MKMPRRASRDSLFIRHAQALVCAFCEAPDAPQPEAASLLGGGGGGAALTPAEKIALAAALRFGPAADGDHRW